VPTGLEELGAAIGSTLAAAAGQLASAAAELAQGASSILGGFDGAGALTNQVGAQLTNSMAEISADPGPVLDGPGAALPETPAPSVPDHNFGSSGGAPPGCAPQIGDVPAATPAPTPAPAPEPAPAPAPTTPPVEPSAPSGNGASAAVQEPTTPSPGGGDRGFVADGSSGEPPGDPPHIRPWDPLLHPIEFFINRSILFPALDLDDPAMPIALPGDLPANPDDDTDDQAEERGRRAIFGDPPDIRIRRNSRTPDEELTHEQQIEKHRRITRDSIDLAEDLLLFWWVIRPLVSPPGPPGPYRLPPTNTPPAKPPPAVQTPRPPPEPVAPPTQPSPRPPTDRNTVRLQPGSGRPMDAVISRSEFGPPPRGGGGGIPYSERVVTQPQTIRKADGSQATRVQEVQRHPDKLLPDQRIQLRSGANNESGVAEVIHEIQHFQRNRTRQGTRADADRALGRMRREGTIDQGQAGGHRNGYANGGSTAPYNIQGENPALNSGGKMQAERTIRKWVDRNPHADVDLRIRSTMEQPPPPAPGQPPPNMRVRSECIELREHGTGRTILRYELDSATGRVTTTTPTTPGGSTPPTTTP
jgi:hypothetical protein